MIHTKENNPGTQRHLDENREKFKSDAEYLLNMLKNGKRLSNIDVAQMGIDNRRLREADPKNVLSFCCSIVFLQPYCW